jgi:integrase
LALNIIQRQLGHANLGTTSIYLQGIDTEEIIATVHARRGPMMSATAGLRLEQLWRERPNPLPPSTTADPGQASVPRPAGRNRRHTRCSSEAGVRVTAAELLCGRSDRQRAFPKRRKGGGYCVGNVEAERSDGSALS